jgi:hypothetical protein
MQNIFNNKFSTSEGFDIDKLSRQELHIFFDVFIEYVLDTIEIDHVEHDGLVFYNRSNLWYERLEKEKEKEKENENENENDYDKNYKCGGYLTCHFGIENYDIVKLLNNNKNSNDNSEIMLDYRSFRLKTTKRISYKLKYNPDHYCNMYTTQNILNDDKTSSKEKVKENANVNEIESLIELDDEPGSLANVNNVNNDDNDEKLAETNRKIYDYIHYALVNNGIEQLKICTTKKISLTNISGFNTDHRGSDHTQIILDFVKTYNLKPNSSIKKFASALYHIKSHKFDTLYELYSACHITVDDTSIKIMLVFDHGY